MTDRQVGTKVHTTLSSSDPTGILPLQESLGYDLASSLFSQSRNLVLEGLTDYWYIEATAELFKSSDQVQLNDKIAKPSDLKQFIYTERAVRSEEIIPFMVTALKVDENSNMGLVSDVKQELRKENMLKISYLSVKPGK